MTKCLICKTSIEPFLSLRKMPIANGFLHPDQFTGEYFYDLAIGFCSTCYMVQLINHVDREKMFHDQYAFFSSTSAHMAAHFKAFADEMKTRYLKGKADPFVAEIGSNDGIFLQHMSHGGIRHLGIEPSGNVAQVAREKGVHTISEFFDEQLAKKIRAKHGPADLFIGANVMCHIPYLHSVMAGIAHLLAEDGRLVFEDPYLGDIIEKTSYDQIYDEHAFYFSVSSMEYLVEQHGLRVVDAQPQSVHGGSMRYTIAHKGAVRVSDRVKNQKKKEKDLGLNRKETYNRFRRHVEASRERLTDLLGQLKQKGASVVGYGATSKSTTVLNYCRIGPDLLSCIYDTTPIKIGTYTPGMHIPVRDYKEFSDKYPDYAVLFAWNHKEEILKKEKQFSRQGGKFIVYISRVRVEN